MLLFFVIVLYYWVGIYNGGNWYNKLIELKLIFFFLFFIRLSDLKTDSDVET